MPVTAFTTYTTGWVWCIVLTHHFIFSEICHLPLTFSHTQYLTWKLPLPQELEYRITFASFYRDPVGGCSGFLSANCCTVNQASRVMTQSTDTTNGERMHGMAVLCFLGCWEHCVHCPGAYDWVPMHVNDMNIKQRLSLLPHTPHPQVCH